MCQSSGTGKFEGPGSGFSGGDTYEDGGWNRFGGGPHKTQHKN